MTTIYRPSTQTPAGIAISTSVSEILAHVADLEERLIRATTDPELSVPRSRIEDRIDVLNSQKYMAASLGNQQEVDDCQLRIEELRGLLRENGE